MSLSRNNGKLVINITLIIPILFLLFHKNTSAQERTDTLYTCRYRVNITEGKKITSFDTTVRVYRSYNKIDTLLFLHKYDQFIPTDFKNYAVSYYSNRKRPFYKSLKDSSLLLSNDYVSYYFINLTDSSNLGGNLIFKIRTKRVKKSPIIADGCMLKRIRPRFGIPKYVFMQKSRVSKNPSNPKVYVCNFYFCTQRWGIIFSKIIYNSKCTLSDSFIFEYSPSGWFSYLSYRRKKQHIEMILLALQKHG